MNKFYILLLTAMLCLSLTGCGLWIQDSYISVKPYQVENVNAEYEMITVASYEQLQEALETMVEDCVQSAIIAVPGFQENTIDEQMSSATNYIIRNNAIGAYAVEQIAYEVGTSGEDLAIAVDISYRYNRSNILRMKRVENAEAASEEIKLALQQYDSGITLYINDYNETDFLQVIQDYVDENPQLCVEMPQVAAAIYPESGQMRVLDLTFDYWNSREVLRSMQENVMDVLGQLEVRGESAQQRATEVYNFLTDLHPYTVETSVTPSYSLLRYGVGDSKAFATVYAAMCREKGIQCKVVSGSRGGVAWYWNAVYDNGQVYYLDILRCYEGTGFRLLQEHQMSGYVWDYSAYRTQ